MHSRNIYIQYMVYSAIEVATNCTLNFFFVFLVKSQ